MPMQGEYEETKVDREIFGVFKEEDNLATGDPYFTIKDNPERFRGKQFGTMGIGCTALPDALIDKTMKLTVGGDVYVDQYKVDKMLTKPMPPITKAFAPSNPSAKGVGHGSLYGTFGPQNTLVDLDASASLRSGPPPNPADRKRNLFIDPPRKGTYGFPISERTIGGTKFAYVPDQYAYGRTLEKTMKADARAKIGKPFVGMGRNGRGIQPAPFLNGPGPDTRPAAAKDAKPAIRWKPSNPQAKGHGDYGCINKLEYIPATVANPPKRAAEKAFKPVNAGHVRLSMWAPNPYTCDARPPPDSDFTLLA